MIKLPLNLHLWLAVVCIAGCKEQESIPYITTSEEYQRGESHLYVHNDSAFYYFNRVAATSRDSLQIAMAYNKMAIIQSDAGDYFGSQESLLTSMQYLDEKNGRDGYCLFSNYNELGITSLNLQSYDAAVNYFDQALKFTSEEPHRLITLNNKALACQRKKQYTEALAIYEAIIEPSKANNIEYARVLSNMAKTRWLKDPGYRAGPELQTALRIRESENDRWGLTASYAHLCEYYMKSRPDSALFYADQLYRLSIELESPDDELDALERLIALGPPEAGKKFFTRYVHLGDSLQTGRNNAKNQFALIRFDAEKHRSDNLVLQKENAEKKVRIIGQQLTITGIVILAIAGFLWYRKRKQQQELRTSQKVHDVVANGLYRLMAKVEHEPHIEKEQFLDDMEQLYEQSRNISYEQAKMAGPGFDQTLATLLKSFSTAGTSVSIVGNTPEVWRHPSSKVKEELKHVLQELMVNMSKHSNAANVVVKFEITGDDMLLVRYMDDGVGLPHDLIYGNGLTNTENRIRNIGGRIIFDRTTSKGLHIQLFIPIFQR